MVALAGQVDLVDLTIHHENILKGKPIVSIQDFCALK